MVKSLHIFIKPDDGHSSENVRIPVLINFLPYNNFHTEQKLRKQNLGLN